MRSITRLTTPLLCLFGCAVLFGAPSARAGSPLQTALGDLYGICLFDKGGTAQNNPFSNAAFLSRSSLAPGITGFIESNLSSIPLTPPSVKSVFDNGQIVNVVTGFSPIFTENSSTVGGGKIFVGGNFSYYDFSKLRGQDLGETSFVFADNNRQDVVTVTMPLDVKASVYTFYGTYGIANNLDLGVALPVVNMSIKADGTEFTVVGNQSNCGYGPTDCDPNTVSSPQTPPLSLYQVSAAVNEDDLSSTFLSTVALRMKYRFKAAPNSGRGAIVADFRLPVRDSNGLLGKGDFGARVTFVGEAPSRGGFTPYVNLGAQLWDGDSSNSLNLAAGFSQLFAQNLSFSFDLLATIDVESDTFLEKIDDQVPLQNDATAVSLVTSSIPEVKREHELNTAIGFQYAVTQDFEAYGSALFSLLDHGLHANVVPTIGLSYHY
ncbi:MAG: hypothetical protein R3E12_11050 [Candidatus Eisenbacteria bacterium]